MNYNDFLENELVKKQYKKIDKINPYPLNHGLKHIINVCNNMNKLCDVIKIDGDKKDALLIACALHDLGQADGREDHRNEIENFY